MHSIRPDVFPFHTADRAHDVNLDRRDAHFQQFASVCDGCWRQIVSGEAERAERLEEARGVVECRPGQDVQIAGETRGSVLGEGISADDDELNAMDSQAPDKLVEVWCEIHRLVSAEIQPQPDALKEVGTASNATAGGCVRRPRLW